MAMDRCFRVILWTGLSTTRWVSADRLGTACGTLRAPTGETKSRLDLFDGLPVTRSMTLLNRRRRPPLAAAARPTRPATHPPIDPAAGSIRPPAVPSPELPPSVARVAERTRLSRELLAAILEVEARTRVSLDDIERADALAERLLARRRERRVRAVA